MTIVPIPGKDLAKRVGDLFTNLLGPVTEELGLTLGERAAFYRMKQLLSLGEKASNLLNGRTIPKNPNLGRILPILEAGSLENDEELHTRWAALLANAIENSSGVLPSYIETLKQLTSADAKALDRVVECGSGKEDDNINLITVAILQVIVFEDTKDFDQVNEVIENLERLGLIVRFDVARDREPLSALGQNSRDIRPIGQVSEDIENEPHYRISRFAVKFVRACASTSKAGVAGDCPK